MTSRLSDKDRHPHGGVQIQNVTKNREPTRKNGSPFDSVGVRTRKKAETAIFVCDNCATRKRLEVAKRHWCDICTSGIPVEMRCVKDKWRNRPDELHRRFD